MSVQVSSEVNFTADEWFADFLHRVSVAGRKRAKALAEGLPMPRDRQLARERAYDRETERLLAEIRGARDVA